METDTEMMERLKQLARYRETVPAWGDDLSPDDLAAIRCALELIERYRTALLKSPKHSSDCEWDWRNCSAANPNVCTCGWAAIRAAALSQDPPPARR
jgi:hypothetical protein